MELFEFKFYKSYTETFKRLPDESAGKLIKRMYSFYFFSEDIETDDILVETIFSQIKYTMEKSIKGKITGGIRKKDNTSQVPSNDTSQGTYKGSSTKDKEQVKEKENIYINELENFLSKWNEIFGKKYELTEDLKKVYKTCRNKYSLEQIQIASSNYYKDKVSKRTKEERKQYELHIIKFLSQKNGLPTYL